MLIYVRCYGVCDIMVTTWHANKKILECVQDDVGIVDVVAVTDSIRGEQF